MREVFSLSPWGTPCTLPPAWFGQRIAILNEKPELGRDRLGYPQKLLRVELELA